MLSLSACPSPPSPASADGLCPSPATAPFSVTFASSSPDPATLAVTFADSASLASPAFLALDAQLAAYTSSIAAILKRLSSPVLSKKESRAIRAAYLREEKRVQWERRTILLEHLRYRWPIRVKSPVSRRGPRAPKTKSRPCSDVLDPRREKAFRELDERAKLRAPVPLPFPEKRRRPRPKGPPSAVDWEAAEDSRRAARRAHKGLQTCTRKCCHGIRRSSIFDAPQPPSSAKPRRRPKAVPQGTPGTRASTRHRHAIKFLSEKMAVPKQRKAAQKAAKAASQAAAEAAAAQAAEDELKAFSDWLEDLVSSLDYGLHFPAEHKEKTERKRPTTLAKRGGGTDKKEKEDGKKEPTTPTDDVRSPQMSLDCEELWSRLERLLKKKGVKRSHVLWEAAQSSCFLRETMAATPAKLLGFFRGRDCRLLAAALARPDAANAARKPPGQGFSVRQVEGDGSCLPTSISVASGFLLGEAQDVREDVADFVEAARGELRSRLAAVLAAANEERKERDLPRLSYGHWPAEIRRPSSWMGTEVFLALSSLYGVGFRVWELLGSGKWTSAEFGTGVAGWLDLRFSSGHYDPLLMNNQPVAIRARRSATPLPAISSISGLARAVRDVSCGHNVYEADPEWAVIRSRVSVELVDESAVFGGLLGFLRQAAPSARVLPGQRPRKDPIAALRLGRPAPLLPSDRQDTATTPATQSKKSKKRVRRRRACPAKQEEEVAEELDADLEAELLSPSPDWSKPEPRQLARVNSEIKGLHGLVTELAKPFPIVPIVPFLHPRPAPICSCQTCGRPLDVVDCECDPVCRLFKEREFFPDIRPLGVVMAERRAEVERQARVEQSLLKIRRPMGKLVPFPFILARKERKRADAERWAVLQPLAALFDEEQPTPEPTLPVSKLEDGVSLPALRHALDGRTEELEPPRPAGQALVDGVAAGLVSLALDPRPFQPPPQELAVFAALPQSPARPSNNGPPLQTPAAQPAALPTASSSSPTTPPSPPPSPSEGDFETFHLEHFLMFVYQSESVAMVPEGGRWNAWLPSWRGESSASLERGVRDLLRGYVSGVDSVSFATDNRGHELRNPRVAIVRARGVATLARLWNLQHNERLRDAGQPDPAQRLSAGADTPSVPMGGEWFSVRISGLQSTETGASLAQVLARMGLRSEEPIVVRQLPDGGANALIYLATAADARRLESAFPDTAANAQQWVARCEKSPDEDEWDDARKRTRKAGLDVMPFRGLKLTGKKAQLGQLTLIVDLKRQPNSQKKQKGRQFIVHVGTNTLGNLRQARRDILAQINRFLQNLGHGQATGPSFSATRHALAPTPPSGNPFNFYGAHSFTADAARRPLRPLLEAFARAKTTCRAIPGSWPGDPTGHPDLKKKLAEATDRVIVESSGAIQEIKDALEKGAKTIADLKSPDQARARHTFLNSYMSLQQLILKASQATGLKVDPEIEAIVVRPEGGGFAVATPRHLPNVPPLGHSNGQIAMEQREEELALERPSTSAASVVQPPPTLRQPAADAHRAAAAPTSAVTAPIHAPQEDEDAEEEPEVVALEESAQSEAGVGAGGPPGVRITKAPVDVTVDLSGPLVKETIIVQTVGANFLRFYLGCGRSSELFKDTRLTRDSDTAWSLTIGTLDAGMVGRCSVVASNDSGQMDMATFKIVDVSAASLPSLPPPRVSRRWLATGLRLMVIGWPWGNKGEEIGAVPSFPNSCTNDNLSQVLMVSELRQKGLLRAFRNTSPEYLDALHSILYGPADADRNAELGIRAARCAVADAMGLVQNQTGLIDLMGETPAFLDALFGEEDRVVLQRLVCPKPDCNPIYRYLEDPVCDLSLLATQELDWHGGRDEGGVVGGRLCPKCGETMAKTTQEFARGELPLVLPVAVVGALGWAVSMDENDSGAHVQRGRVQPAELLYSLQHIVPSMIIGGMTYNLGGVILDSHTTLHFTALLPVGGTVPSGRVWAIYDGNQVHNADRIRTIFQTDVESELGKAAELLTEVGAIPSLLLYVASPSRVGEDEEEANAGWATASRLEPDESLLVDQAALDLAFCERLLNEDAGPASPRVPATPVPALPATPVPLPGDIVSWLMDLDEPMVSVEPSASEISVVSVRPVEAGVSLFSVKRVVGGTAGQLKLTELPFFTSQIKNPTMATHTLHYHVQNSHAMQVIVAVEASDAVHWTPRLHGGKLRTEMILEPRTSAGFKLCRHRHKLPPDHLPPPSITVFWKYGAPKDLMGLRLTELRKPGTEGVFQKRFVFRNSPSPKVTLPARPPPPPPAAQPLPPPQAAQPAPSPPAAAVAASSAAPPPPRPIEGPTPMPISQAHQLVQKQALKNAAPFASVPDWTQFRRHQQNIPSRPALREFNAEVNSRLRVAVDGDVFGLAVDAAVNAANPQLALDGMSGVTGRLRDLDNPYQQQYVDAHVPDLYGGLGDRAAAKLVPGAHVLTPLHLVAPKVCINILAPNSRIAAQRAEAFELIFQGLRGGLHEAVMEGCRTMAVPLLGCGVYLQQPAYLRKEFDEDVVRETLLTAFFSAIRTVLVQCSSVSIVVVVRGVADTRWVALIGQRIFPVSPAAKASLGGVAILGQQEVELAGPPTVDIRVPAPVYAVGIVSVYYAVESPDFAVENSHHMASPDWLSFKPCPEIVIPATTQAGVYKVRIRVRPYETDQDTTKRKLADVSDPTTEVAYMTITIHSKVSRKRKLQSE